MDGVRSLHLQLIRRGIFDGTSRVSNGEQRRSGLGMRASSTVYAVSDMRLSYNNRHI